MYGGMDSDSITERIREPSGLTIAIQQRMATEMACRGTALDFTRTATERKLFRYVEPTTTPLNSDGTVNAQAVSMIKHNLQHLHWVLLGEQLDINSSELQASYDLFYQVWAQGQELLANYRDYEPRPGTSLEGECRARWYRAADGRTNGDMPEELRLERDENYSIRAWMAVITYLLSDYRFAYE